MSLLLPAVPASATTLFSAETRVGASGPATAVAVGVHECITAGQRPVRGPSQLQVVVGNCVAAEAGAPRFITTGSGVTIDRAAVSASVSGQKQGRHVLGAREYGGGSYFNSADDAQRVLDDFHGGGATVLGVKGNDIVIRTNRVTGFNHNPGAGYPNQATNVFFIKGGASPSVVPYNPTWRP